MPLPAADTEARYTGNGVATQFSLACKIAKASDFVAELDGVVTTDYTLSGVGSDSGVVCTFSTPPGSLVEVLLYRDAPYSRTDIDYQLALLKPDTLDEDHDHGVMLSQQLATALKRVPQAPRGNLSLDLALVPEASKLLAWASDALSLVNVDPATVTPAALIFTAIGQALATAGSAAAARTAIGAVAQADVDASLAAQFYGQRNRAINGSFLVNQRQTTSVAPTTAALGFFADMWQARTSAAPSGTLSVATTIPGSSPGDPYAFARVLRSAGTYTGHIYLEQVVSEAADVYPLAGKTVTLQAKIRKNAGFSGASVRLSVLTGSVAGETWASLAAGTWTTLASAQAVDVPAASLSTSFQTFSGQVTIPAGTKEIAIRFEVRTFSGAGSANDYVDVTDIGLAYEDTASKYEPVPFGLELTRCMRWYEKSWPYSAASPAGLGGAVIQRAQGVGGTLDTAIANYRVPKATVATPTWYSTNSGAAGYVYDSTGAADVATVSTTSAGDGSTGAANIAAAVAGRLYFAHWAVNCIS